MQWCIILDDCIALLLWKAWRRIDIFFRSAPSINLWTTVHKFESVLGGAVGPWCGCNRMTVTVGLHNGFALIRQQALIWTNDGLVRWSYLRQGAVTCAVCPESAWLVTFLIGNVSTGVVTWSALRCGASGESGKKVAAAPLSKTAAAAAAAKTWFAKHPVDYILHNRFPWKRSGRRSSMWPPYSLRRNLSAAACRPCDRSLTRPAMAGCMSDAAMCQWMEISNAFYSIRMSKYWLKYITGICSCMPNQYVSIGLSVFI